ncbi:hypothetical protein Pan216_32980 [Planctomycetes bacterium Pan216]|uniref:Carboxypeptidase regulatory-like domain-containing protein n=1 Tax=Kolteria novifilia TaxID=2527975 RepID=A0A518B627_9BACT|nr:hypothetical protein Pan216_32980 [Planctomycetes bacterium Pan216]
MAEQPPSPPASEGDQNPEEKSSEETSASTPAVAPVRSIWRERAIAQLHVDPKTARKRRIFGLLATSAVLIGMMAGMLYWLRPVPRPHFIPLWVTHYDSPLLPDNPFGQLDRDAIQQGMFFPETSDVEFESESAFAFRRKLTDLSQIDAMAGVVVYVSAFTITGPKGDLYIMPRDFRHADISSRVALKEILDALKKCPAQGKLLVLDIMKPIGDFRVGDLVEDAGLLVQDELKKVPDPTRLVLLSCSPGQTALVSQSQRRSVFSYYFEEGLRGWADLYNESQSADGLVSVKEIGAFVQARVDRWASSVRGKRQTPQMIGSGDDFMLVAVPYGEPPAMAPLPNATQLAAVQAKRYPDPQSAKSSADSKNGSSSASDSKNGSSSKSASSKSDSKSGATSPKSSASQKDAKGKTPAKPKLTPEEQKQQEAKQKAEAEEKALVDRVFPPVPYPTWLSGGWTLLDQWQRESVIKASPWTFRQLSATLLQAERNWRNGSDVTQLQKRVIEATTRLHSQMNALANIPRPTPRSLTQAKNVGATPDPTIDDAVTKLIDQWNSDKQSLKPDAFTQAADKLVSDFVKKYGNADTFALSWAIFQAALADTSPTPDRLNLYVSLLNLQGAPPQYVETLRLVQLAHASAAYAPNTWPTGVAHNILQLSDYHTSATAYPRSFQWIEPMLSVTVQKEHDGLALFFAPLYAPAPQAEPILKSVDESYQVILYRSQVVQSCWQNLDDAMVSISAYAIPPGQLTARKGDWQTAATTAEKLFGMMASRPSAAALSADELLRQELDEVIPLSGDLGQALTSLQANSDSDVVERFANQMRTGRGTGDSIGMVLLRLETPFIASAQRVDLWNSLLIDEQRAVLTVLRQDERENQDMLITNPQSVSSDQTQQAVQSFKEAAKQKANKAVTLLQVGNATPQVINEVNALIKLAGRRGASPALWGAVSSYLNEVWTEKLLDQFDSSKSPNEKVRLTAILNPLQRIPELESPTTDPLYQMRASAARKLWEWLARTSQYFSTDAYTNVARIFFSSASQDFLLGGILPNSTQVSIQPVLVKTSPDQQSVTYDFNVTLRLPPKEKPKISFAPTSASGTGLDLSVPEKAVEALAAQTSALRQATIPVTATLSPGSSGLPTTSPVGFMGVLTVGSRTYHQLVSFPDPSPFRIDQVEILLAQGATEPTGLMNDLRLRPIGKPVPLYLYIANPSSQDRNLTVQLTAGDVVASAKLAVKGNQTGKVTFPPPAASPAPAAPSGAAPKADAGAKREPSLPSLSGPIVVTVLDDGTKPPKEIATRTFQSSIAKPSDYTTVTSILYSPISPPRQQSNRLSVGIAANRSLTNPPASVEMVFPAKQIPGFRAALRGTMRGDLPIDGTALQLFASDIEFSTAAPVSGPVYLNVDGQQRAYIFTTTFDRFGPPTTPQLDLTPAIRIDAPRISRAGATFAMRLEVDNAPPNATVSVRLGRRVGATYVTDLLQNFMTAKNEVVGFSPYGKKGALEFEASINDWKPVLNTSNILGRRTLVAELIDKDQQVVARDFWDVILDNVPPEQVAFLNPPLIANPGQVLRFNAIGTDNVSGIIKANFFFGKPVKGALPPKVATIPGAPLNASYTLWAADLQISDQAKGAIDVSVELVNAVGLSTFASTTLKVIPKGQVDPSNITGKVVEGALGQPGLTVDLFDLNPKTGAAAAAAAAKSASSTAKGKDASKEPPKPTATTKTKPDGTFSFEKLKPGKYKLTTSKPASGRKAEALVDLPPGKTVNVVLSLLLNPPTLPSSSASP